MADQMVKSVLIVGRDAAAWLTALSLRRAFSSDLMTIRVLELPSLLVPSDFYSTLPGLRNLHHVIGLAEEDILRVAKAVPILGQRFSGWSGGAAPFVHAYDTHGAGFDGVDFIQYWLRARGQGMNVPLEEFSLGAVAAKQGKAAVLSPELRTFSSASHGLNLSALSYVRAVRSLALRLGVELVPARFNGAQVENGVISGIAVEGDAPAVADLYIDATGADASLIRSLDGGQFEDWSHWLPCDRQIVARSDALKPVPAFNQITATRAGWLGMFPLQDSTNVAMTYSSAWMGEAEALETMQILGGLTLKGDAISSQVSPGARDAWRANCVAIGDSAAIVEPLDAGHLHMIHVGVSNLVQMFPQSCDRMIEAGAYNRAVSAYARNLRDFSIAHYRLNRRFDDGLWNAVRTTAGPASLDRRIDLFAARGRVLLEDHEAMSESNWTSILIGHGLIPRSYDRLADKMPESEQMQFFQRMLGFIAQEVRGLPSLESHLEIVSPGHSQQAGF